MSNAPHYSPSDMLVKTQRRIIFYIHLWTLIFVLPFTFYQLAKSNLWLGLLLSALCLNNAIVVYYLHYRDAYLMKGFGFVSLACLCVMLAGVVNGAAGLFWAYPCVLGIFFLLPLRTAFFVSALFVAAEFVIALQVSSVGLSLRFVASLFLTSAFAYVISLLVDRQHSSLLKLATTDLLTQCTNRTELNPALSQARHMHARYKQAYSLLLIDLDHFKRINDTHGHLMGDTVLKEFANLMKARLRTTDKLFRYGGEEFVALLPNTGLTEALILAENLRVSVEGHAFSHHSQLTTSIGVSTLQTNESHEKWLDRADAGLYQAKTQGRNRVIAL